MRSLGGALFVLVVCYAWGYSRVAALRNLDILNPMVFSGGLNSQSDFGFSVSFHTAKSSTFVLVGAPKDDIPNGAALGIAEPGAVYQCPPQYDASCSQMDVDNTGNTRFFIPAGNGFNYSEAKSYQRMGATLMSAGADNVVVACANHYHYTYARENYTTFYGGLNWTQIWDPVGKCHVIPSTFVANESVNFTPCLPEAIFGPTPKAGTATETMYCNTGVTMDIAPTYLNQQRRSALLLGAPGFRDGVGTTYAAALNVPRSSGRFLPVNAATTRTMPVYLYENNNVIVRYPETLFRRSTNTGWSTTQGDFNGDSQHEIAIAKPQANPSFNLPGEEWTKKPFVLLTAAAPDETIMVQNSRVLTGQLLTADRRAGPGLYQTILNGSSPDVENYVRILGQQNHEFFGYAMISFDTDADGSDELFISAPMYTVGLDDDGSTDNDRNGRVYIYSSSLTNATDVVFKNKASRFAEIAKPDRILMTGVSGSQFGLSMSRLGDINHDGYNDVAIGSPFEGERHGAVYAFYGSSAGLSVHQRITPSSIGQPDLVSFGWSLSPGMDADQNTYNDLLVGAPMSNKAVAFRSRPVLRLAVIMNFTSLVDFVQGRCPPPNQHLACVPVRVCFNPTSDTPLTSPIDISYTLTSRDPARRQPNLLLQAPVGRRNMSVPELTRNFTLSSHNQSHCFMETIFLRAILVRPCQKSVFSLRWSTQTLPSTRSALSHIVVEERTSPLTGNVTFVRDCPTCKPDLTITAVTAQGGIDGQSSNVVFAGPGRPTKLRFSIANRGTVLVCQPRLLLSLSSTLTAAVLNERLSCMDATEPMLCIPRATLLPGLSVDVSFDIDGSSLSLGAGPVQLNVSISSSNPNPEDARTLFDNDVSVSLDVRSEAVLSTGSLANPSLVNVSSTTAANFKTQAVHIHSVTNNGPGKAPPLTVLITYPLSLPDGGLEYASLQGVQATRQRITCDYNETGLQRAVTSATSSSRSMRCQIPALNAGQSAGVRLIFHLETGQLRTGGHLSSGLSFSTSSKLVNVTQVPGFIWNRTQSSTITSATTKISLIGGTDSSGVPWLAIWLPIVLVLLLIILILVLLKHQGFFERGKHLEQLMAKSTMTAVGVIGASTDGMYRKSTEPPPTTTENGAKRASRPSLTRQESSI